MTIKSMILNKKNRLNYITYAIVILAYIVLQLLSYVAQTEREFIRQRQAEGIAAAKARGVQYGRKPMERPLEYEETKAIWQKGEISAREAGRRLGISHRTFLIWVNEAKE